MCLLTSCLALVVSCAPASSPPPPAFSTFWNEFRPAVLAGLVDEVASMTRFPLEVRGPDDADPVVTKDRDSFGGVLEQVMNQDSGVRAEGETVRQYLQRMDDIGEANVEPDGHAAAWAILCSSASAIAGCSCAYTWPKFSSRKGGSHVRRNAAARIEGPRRQTASTVGQ